jgi:hypothetical protein
MQLLLILLFWRHTWWRKYYGTSKHSLVALVVINVAVDTEYTSISTFSSKKHPTWIMEDKDVPKLSFLVEIQTFQQQKYYCTLCESFFQLKTLPNVFFLINLKFFVSLWKGSRFYTKKKKKKGRYYRKYLLLLCIVAFLCIVY